MVPILSTSYTPPSVRITVLCDHVFRFFFFFNHPGPRNLTFDLGTNLVLSSPPKEQRLAILNDVWAAVTTIEDPKHYITVAEVRLCVCVCVY